MPILLALIYVLILTLALFSSFIWAQFLALGIALVHVVDLTKRVLKIKIKIPVVDKIIYILNAYFLSLWGIFKYERGDYNEHWRRVKNAPTKRVNSIKIIKRVVDIFGSAIGLVLLTPLMVIVSILIKFTSEGPVLFKQLRVGESSDDFVALFHVLKFRSMVVDAELKSGAVWASKDDPRITPIGRFMRKTRIDELPQLWNVLMGDMSLIGPRPERPIFYSKLEKDIPYFSQRTYGIKPGISGLAQVMNGYDETIDDARNKIGWDYAYMLSTSSATSWCKMEIDILIRTFVVIFTGKGQ